MTNITAVQAANSTETLESSLKKPLLGVNIDHVATLRQARGVSYPSPLAAALLCEQAGADGITIHLREDRRHIQDADVYEIAEQLTTRMNLEIAATTEMLEIARKVKPFWVCLVPEKRAELTTEGGLDVLGDGQEGAHSQEVGEHHVVDENRPYEQIQVFHLL